jgi:hypothetical protein
MVLGRRRRRAVRRRSGPADEERWWDPDDQAFAESYLIAGRDFPKGWRPLIMLQNLERLDPWEGVEAASELSAARRDRRLTALDEGSAFRDRDNALVVLRVEVFAEQDDAEHRARWQADAREVLLATWRARWREREVDPGWIEVRAHEHDPIRDPDRDGDAVDWYVVEDHTDPGATGDVAVHHHVTVWAGRALLTLTLRHSVGVDQTAQVRYLAERLVGRAAATLPRGHATPS